MNQHNVYSSIYYFFPSIPIHIISMWFLSDTDSAKNNEYKNASYHVAQ